MATRRYETDELVVLWDSQRCVHVAYCIAALPSVFNPLARPWVRMNNATTEEIVDAVERCPTGALRYERKAGPPEAAPEETSIVPVTNGPLVLRGRLHVITPEGATVARETRLALCRCGASQNQPFCDNSHRRIDFHGQPPRLSEERERAQSPNDVAPQQPQSFR